MHPRNYPDQSRQQDGEGNSSVGEDVFHFARSLIRFSSSSHARFSSTAHVCACSDGVPLSERLGEFGDRLDRRSTQLP